MSANLTLSAAQADGFYNPPTWDPSQQSRDRFQGSRGANQFQQRGIVRFELPWAVWCNGCEAHIARGVRFNAKKTRAGNYFSTAIWRFNMTCPHCKHPFEVQTDPANRDLKCVSGLRQKVTAKRTDALALQRLREEAEAVRNDPLAQLEQREDDKRAQQIKRDAVEIMRNIHEAQGREDDFKLNSKMRSLLRVRRKHAEAAQGRISRSGGLNIALAEPSADDSLNALQALASRPAKKRRVTRDVKNARRRWRKLISESARADAELPPLEPDPEVVSPTEDIECIKHAPASSSVNADVSDRRKRLRSSALVAYSDSDGDSD
ncbi:MAG: hypothetical protein MHM6MM_000627 [Cercozoa sp. M6MM]